MDILKRPGIYLLGLIPLAIWIVYTIIKKIRTKIQRRQFLSKIKREINNVKETFENDILSKSIFHFTAWNSDYNNWKRQIANNYDDYNLINKFYETLRERDITFSQENIKKEIIKDYNEYILSLSNIILTNIIGKNKILR